MGYYIKIADSFQKRLEEMIYVNLSEMIEGKRYTTTYEVYFNKRDYTEDFNCFTIPKKSPNNVSYWPHADYHLQPTNPETGLWKQEGRKLMKLIDFVNKYLFVHCYIVKKFVYDNGLITEIEIDNQGARINEPILRTKIVNRATELLIDKNKAEDIQVVPKIAKAGDKRIKGIYGLIDAPYSGTLNSSCMRPSSTHNVRHFAEFYDHCPCSIVYDVNAEGQLLYRAILWDLVDGTKYLDRQYGRPEMALALQEWAVEQGYKSRNYDNNIRIPISAELSEDAMNYLLTVGRPYPDSFTIISDSKLYNMLDNNLIDFEFDGTSGSTITLKKKCEECGYRYNDDRLRLIDGKLLCRECRGNRDVCVACSEVVEDDDKRTNDDGDVYCEDCYYERYDTCEACGDEAVTGSLNDCNGSYYCNVCADDKGYKQCEDCDEWKKDCMYVTDADKWVCESCWDSYFNCYRCGDSYSDEQINTIISDEGYEESVCNECYKKYTFTCSVCDNKTETLNEVKVSTEGTIKYTDTEVCLRCHRDDFKECINCHEDYPKEDFTDVNVKDVKEPISVCPICREKLFRKCTVCGQWSDWIGCNNCLRIEKRKQATKNRISNTDKKVVRNKLRAKSKINKLKK